MIQDLDKKLYGILLLTEILPRVVTVCMFKIFIQVTNWEHLGNFICKSFPPLDFFTMTSRDRSSVSNLIQIQGGRHYYFWFGRERENLKRQQVDWLDCILFLLRFVQLGFIFYVLSTLFDEKVLSKFFIIICLVVISTVLYCIRFIVFVIKKTLRCMCGDNCCRY